MSIWGRREPEEEQNPVLVTGGEAGAATRAAEERPASKGASMETRKAIIGPSIQVKGELIGKEDLVIEGKVEGVVRLRDHHLVIGKTAVIEATLEAKSIRIEGTVRGDVMAGERVELATGSTLTGDIVAPRISIADGARFKGSVDMDRSGTGKAEQAGKKSPVTTRPPGKESAPRPGAGA